MGIGVISKIEIAGLYILDVYGNLGILVAQNFGMKFVLVKEKLY